MVTGRPDREMPVENDSLESKTRVEARALRSRAQAVLVKVILGPNGLRAGWRLLLFILTAVIVGFLLSRILPSAAQGLTPGGFIRGEGIGFLSLVLAGAVMARVENRSFADYALPLRNAFAARFWFGALWGFIGLTAVLVAIRAERGFSFGTVLLGGTRLATYAALWAIAFLLVGLLEEFQVNRGLNPMP